MAEFVFSEEDKGLTKIDPRCLYINYGDDILFKNDNNKSFIDVNDSYKDNLLASLYSQIEFLRKELQEKNIVIRTLLIPSNDTPQSSMEENIDVNSCVSINDSLISNKPYSNITAKKKDTGVIFNPPLKETEDMQRNLPNQLKEIESSDENKINLDAQRKETTKTQSLIISNKKAWEPGTHLIVGDSTILGIEEKRMGKRVKVRGFPGAIINDFYDYLKPLLEQEPSFVTIMTCTDDMIEKDSDDILDEILNLKQFVENKLPDCKVKISCPTMRFGNDKLKVTTLNLRKKLLALNILQL